MSMDEQLKKLVVDNSKKVNDTAKNMDNDKKSSTMNTHYYNYDPDIKFTKILKDEQKDTKYSKTTDKKELTALAYLIVNDYEFQASIAHMCVNKLGGKQKIDRLKHNAIIKNKTSKLELYGTQEGCGYQGILKLYPSLVMKIWEANASEDDKMGGKRLKYANGLEQCFSFEDLKILGLSNNERFFCWLELIKQIGVLINKEQRNDVEKKTLQNLVNMSNSYPKYDDYIKDKPSVIAILAKMKDLKLGSSVNINIKEFKNTNVNL